MGAEWAAGQQAVMACGTQSIRWGTLPAWGCLCRLHHQSSAAPVADAKIPGIHSPVTVPVSPLDAITHPKPVSAVWGTAWYLYA
jgi:hypothetical protein